MMQRKPSSERVVTVATLWRWAVVVIGCCFCTRDTPFYPHVREGGCQFWRVGRSARIITVG